MTESPAMLPRGWRYGLHPNAVGMQYPLLWTRRAPDRRGPPSGDVHGDDQGGPDDAYVQYYICTESGGWGL